MRLGNGPLSASAILRLQKVGFTAEQVEALADFMDTQAASKSDVLEVKSELKADIAELRNELKADIAEVRNELKADFASVHAALQAESAERRSEMKMLEQRMAIKMGGMMVVLAGLILAGMRLLLPH